MSEQQQQQKSKKAYQLVKDQLQRNRADLQLSRTSLGYVLQKNELEILCIWTEYCSELYKYESYGNNTVLDCSQHLEGDLQSILRKEVEIAVAALKKGEVCRS